MSKTRNSTTSKKAGRKAKSKNGARSTKATKPADIVVAGEDTVVTTPTKPTADSGNAPSKNLSGLDAAAEVLNDSDVPLNATELVRRILEGRLWRTKGKTPAATIYSAMIREIKVKGSKARFKKVDRGRFAAAAG